MHSEEKARCEEFGEYLVSHGTTVREAARYFGMSKRTVHKGVTTALKYKNPALAGTEKRSEELLERAGIPLRGAKSVPKKTTVYRIGEKYRKRVWYPQVRAIRLRKA